MVKWGAMQRHHGNDVRFIPNRSTNNRSTKLSPRIITFLYVPQTPDSANSKQGTLWSYANYRALPGGLLYLNHMVSQQLPNDTNISVTTLRQKNVASARTPHSSSKEAKDERRILGKKKVPKVGVEPTRGLPTRVWVVRVCQFRHFGTFIVF